MDNVKCSQYIAILNTNEMSNEFEGIIITSTVGRNREDLLLLQSEVSSKIPIALSEQGDFRNFDGQTYDLILNIAGKTLGLIDGVALKIFADKLCAYIDKNYAGKGEIKIETKKDTLSIELISKNPTKEDLELQIKQFADTVLKNLPKEKRFISNNELGSKMIFSWNGESRTLTPMDFEKYLEDLNRIYRAGMRNLKN